MKNAEYLVMVKSAENLYIVQKEYQEWIDTLELLLKERNEDQDV